MIFRSATFHVLNAVFLVSLGCSPNIVYRAPNASTALQLTSLSPSTGPISGNKTITLRGANLQGADVSVGGSPCSAPSVQADGTELLCTLGLNSPGVVDVEVRKSSGEAVTLSQSFLYTVPLVIHPPEVDLAPVSSLRFNALGGIPPYTFSVVSGGGSVDSAGTYTSGAALDETATLEVRDQFNNLATAQIRVAEATTVRMCQGSVFTSARTGHLYDSGGATANYSNQENCNLLIHPLSGPITLTFWSLRTELNFDYLKIYDGMGAGGTPLHSDLGWTGAVATPFSITAPSGSAYIVFTSDGGAVDSGFSMVWRVAQTFMPLSLFRSLTGIFSIADVIPLTNFSAGPMSGYSWDFGNNGSMDTITESPTSGIGAAVGASGTIPVKLISDSLQGAQAHLDDSSIHVSETHSMCVTTESTALSGVLYDQGGPSLTQGVGHYAQTANCDFLIHPPTSGPIYLKFTELNLEPPDTLCQYDTLDVYDGTDASGILLGSLCGQRLPTDPWVAQSGSVFLHFKSDVGGEGSGFRMAWSTQTPLSPPLVGRPSYTMCNATTQSTEPLGILYDSGGPQDPYADNQNCGFLIQPSGGGKIQLTFEVMDTEIHATCGYDYVRVYQGVDASAPLLATYCSHQVDLAPLVGQDALYVVWHSDGGSTAPGFAAHWEVAGATTPITAFAVSTQEAYVGQQVQFLDRSLNGPTSWAWDIDSDGILDSLEAFPLLSYITPGLKTVTLTASGDSTSDTLSQTHFIQVHPSYNICGPTRVVTDIKGGLFDSGGPTTSYSPNESCSIRIAPPGATSITLDFLAFGLENGADTLKIYDGPNSSAPALHPGAGFSGIALPSQITTSTGEVYLEFSSNSSVTYPGFELKWTSTP